MVRIVLTADETLMSSYRDIALLDFLGCAPSELVPRPAYSFLQTKSPHRGGILLQAPYSLRKVEAALLAQGFDRDEVVVVHPDHIERFVDERTTIVGLSVMDPMGLGPVTMMFTVGGAFTSYTKLKFLSLVKRINALKKRYGFKFVVGGQGCWQLVGESEGLGIDHLVIGETDHLIGELFREIENGSAERTVRIRGFPTIDQIPCIVGASYKGMVEVMRGCGRNCRFCSPNLRLARYYPVEKVLKEVEVNVRSGIDRAWLHSDDIFLYKLKDRRNFYPNTEEVVELFERVRSTFKLRHMNPTHGSIAPVVADPTLLPRLSEASGANAGNWIGVQSGLETGSPDLIKKSMENKAKPFSCEEWPNVVIEGTYLFNLNYWYPAYTLIVGLPGETEEDALETAQLIVTMEKVLDERLGRRGRFIAAPLAYVPLGLLRGGRFDVAEQMTQARFLVIYHAWKHILREVQGHMAEVMPHRALNMMVAYPLSRFGSRLILDQIRTWGIKNGFDPDRPLKPLELNIAVPAK